MPITEQPTETLILPEEGTALFLTVYIPERVEYGIRLPAVAGTCRVDSLRVRKDELVSEARNWPWDDTAKRWTCSWTLYPGSRFVLLENRPDQVQIPNGSVLRVWEG